MDAPLPAKSYAAHLHALAQTFTGTRARVWWLVAVVITATLCMVGATAAMFAVALRRARSAESDVRAAEATLAAAEPATWDVATVVGAGAPGAWAEDVFSTPAPAAVPGGAASTTTSAVVWPLSETQGTAGTLASATVTGLPAAVTAQVGEAAPTLTRFATLPGGRGHYMVVARARVRLRAAAVPATTVAATPEFPSTFSLFIVVGAGSAATLHSARRTLPAPPVGPTGSDASVEFVGVVRALEAATPLYVGVSGPLSGATATAATDGAVFTMTAQAMPTECVVQVVPLPAYSAAPADA